MSYSSLLLVELIIFVQNNLLLLPTIKEDCFFDIHFVLVTQVNDQKIQRQLTADVFFSYKSAVVNYRWSILVFYLCFYEILKVRKTVVTVKSHH